MRYVGHDGPYPTSPLLIVVIALAALFFVIVGCVLWKHRDTGYVFGALRKAK